MCAAISLCTNINVSRNNQPADFISCNNSLNTQLQIDDGIADYPEPKTAPDNQHSRAYGGPSTSKASLLPVPSSSNACFLPGQPTSNAGISPATGATDEQLDVNAGRLSSITTVSRLPILNALRLSAIAISDVSVDVISREINVPYVHLGQQPDNSNHRENA